MGRLGHRDQIGIEGWQGPLEGQQQHPSPFALQCGRCLDQPSVKALCPRRNGGRRQGASGRDGRQSCHRIVHREGEVRGRERLAGHHLLQQREGALQLAMSTDADQPIRLPAGDHGQGQLHRHTDGRAHAPRRHGGNGGRGWQRCPLRPRGEQRPRLPGLTVIQTTGQGINIQQGKGGAHGNTRGDPSRPGEHREFQTAKIAFFALTA